MSSGVGVFAASQSVAASQFAASRRSAPTGSSRHQQNSSSIRRHHKVVVAAAAGGDDTAAAPTGGSRVWHLPASETSRETTQAASTISKLPPHVLGDGGLDPATQPPSAQQAYLGSLAQNYLPVDLSFPGVRVLNVDPPIFSIPNFMSEENCDALVAAAEAEGGKAGEGAHAIGQLLPKPLVEGEPMLVSQLDALCDKAKNFVRCDGAWLDGNPMNAWGMDAAAFKDAIPPGAFAFELPSLNSVAAGETAEEAAGALELDEANLLRYQRRAVVKVFLSESPAKSKGQSGADDASRDDAQLKFDVVDLGIAPEKGSAICFFPSFADGQPDERTLFTTSGNGGGDVWWMDMPCSWGLSEDLRAPRGMAEIMDVEKIDEVTADTKRSNKKVWRANAGMARDKKAVRAEKLKEKLEEIKELNL